MTTFPQSTQNMRPRQCSTWAIRYLTGHGLEWLFGSGLQMTTLVAFAGGFGKAHHDFETILLNRVAFDGCCPDCKFAGDDCPLVSCKLCIRLNIESQNTQYLGPGLLPCRMWTLLDICFPGVGSVQPLLSHPLHHEVAGNSANPASVPHVQAGLEIQGVNSYKTKLKVK